MATRQERTNTLTHEVGVIDRSKYAPAYMDMLQVYNFSGETINFVSSEGNHFVLPAVDNPSFSGQLIVRKEIKWIKGGQWASHLNHYQRLSKEERADSIQRYSEANDPENAYNNGGYHTCTMDAMIELPTPDNPNTSVSCKHPDIIFGRKEGLRTLELLYCEKYNSVANMERPFLVGIVVAKEEMAIGTMFIHVGGIITECCRVNSDHLPPGSVICMVTGHVIARHEEDVEGNIEVHPSMDSVIDSIADEQLEEFSYREGDELTNIQSRAENVERNREVMETEKEKVKIAEEARLIKRAGSITDIASSMATVENKILMENARTVLGAVTSLIK